MTENDGGSVMNQEWPQIGDKGFRCLDERDLDDALWGHNELPENAEEVIEVIVFVARPYTRPNDEIWYLNISDPWDWNDYGKGEKVNSGLYKQDGDVDNWLIKRTRKIALLDKAEAMGLYAARCAEYAKRLKQWGEEASD
jgi:hypothetical protein